MVDEVQSETEAVEIGVVAADPLRSLGLQTILEEAAGVRSVPLSLEEISGGAMPGLRAAVLDSSCVASLPAALTQLRRVRPEIRVVVVGESLDPNHIQAVIAAGAKGYISGTADEAEIRMAIEVVLDGSVWAPRKVLARLIEAGGVTKPDEESADRIFDRMTPRERDVLDLLMMGQGNRQIAESMGVDTVTVKAHLGRMLRKAGVTNRVELTLRAMRDRGRA